MGTLKSIFKKGEYVDSNAGYLQCSSLRCLLGTRCRRLGLPFGQKRPNLQWIPSHIRAGQFQN